MCNCSKNQTPEMVFDHVKSSKKNLRDEKFIGFGLFLVPAPQFGIHEFGTVIVENISYNECIKRGLHCESFQWIPKGYSFEYNGKNYNIETKDDIINLEDLCNKTCGSSCPMGCHCWQGDTYCSHNRYLP